MLNAWSFWVYIYIYTLQCADENAPTHFFSRIDGTLLPQERDWD